MPVKLNYRGKGFIIALGEPIAKHPVIYRSPYAEGLSLDWGNEQSISNEQAIALIQKDVESLHAS